MKDSKIQKSEEVRNKMIEVKSKKVHDKYHHESMMKAKIKVD